MNLGPQLRASDCNACKHVQESPWQKCKDLGFWCTSRSVEWIQYEWCKQTRVTRSALHSCKKSWLCTGQYTEYATLGLIFHPKVNIYSFRLAWLALGLGRPEEAPAIYHTPSANINRRPIPFESNLSSHGRISQALLSIRSLRISSTSRLRPTAIFKVSGFFSISARKWFTFFTCLSCIVLFGGTGMRIPSGKEG